MQQEDLLREIRDELKEVKRQLRALTDSIEMKNKIEEKKPKYHVNQEHTEARRIAREWHEQRIIDRERKEKKRRSKLSNEEDPHQYSSPETESERQE
jgi:hypothetical protein